MTTIQIRIDEETKRKGKKVLDELGLDLSSAITAYLKRVIAVQGLPFSLTTKNGLTVEEERHILEVSDEARRGVNLTKAMTVKQALAYLKKRA